MNIKLMLRKVFFISLPGLFIFLLLLELGLRAGGVLYLKLQYHKPCVTLADRTKDAVTILCLGDSFTQGSGVDLDNRYPSQLEKLLQKSINKDIVVINKGRGGNTSSLLLNNLEKEINEHGPQVVIIMVGINNRWNYERSSYFRLYRDHIGFWDKSGEGFSEWRVYKLMKIIALRITSKNNKDNTQEFNDDRIRNILISSIKSDSLDAYNAGLNFLSKGAFDLARQKYKEALAIDKSNYMAHLQLAIINISNKQYLLAKEEMWQAIYTIDSKAYGYCLNIIFNLIDQLQDNAINRQLELKELKKYLEATYKESNKKILLRTIDAKLKIYEDESILAEVFRYDLKEIIKLSTERGAAVILQTYPRKWYSLFNNVVRQISKEYDIALVDNEKIFSEEAQHVDRERFFIADGHCTEKGYRLIAENTYNALVGQGFFPSAKKEKSSTVNFKSNSAVCVH